MAIEVFNRYEKKYLLSKDDYEYVLGAISDRMVADKFNGDGRLYNIANIYYDTINDDIIARSIEKPDYKEKLRLRSYGVPTLDSKVFLEVKKKSDGLVNKRRTKILLKDAYSLVNNGESIAYKDFMNKQVMREIEYYLSRHTLVPRAYVTYDRRAFFDREDDDFRVTFDTNIRSRRVDVRLEAGNHGDLILDNSKWLMEIKSSKAIPLWFVKVLSEKRIYPMSFSKYGNDYRKYMQEKKKVY